MGLHTCPLRCGHSVKARAIVTAAGDGGGSQGRGPEAAGTRVQSPGGDKWAAGLQAPAPPAAATEAGKASSDGASDMATDPASFPR